MDSDQGHFAKCCKTISNSPFTYGLLPEICNMLYKYTALPEGVDPELHTFKTVTQEANIMPLDTVCFFYLDAVNKSGKSTLFKKDIVQMAELTQEVLTLVMLEILFIIDMLHALEIFAETFAAYLFVCNITLELHIELNFANVLSKNDLEQLGS